MTLHVPQLFTGSKVVLAFDGLDTFAKVWLNDNKILESDNMFVPQRTDITGLVEPDEEYTLEVEFEPALTKGELIRAEHPEHKWLDFVGETSRPAVRKSQYHWGWDWGPIITCAGVWRPVHLEIYHARVSTVRAEVVLAPDFGRAQVRVTATCETNLKESLSMEMSLFLGDEMITNKSNLSVVDGHFSPTLEIQNPLLWMPAGYGSQTLYNLEVKLCIGDQELDRAKKRIGVRKTELVQRPDAYGKSFYFRVNDVDIFCGGACWIPADSMLTNIDSRRYRQWIELLLAANQVMIRQVKAALV